VTKTESVPARTTLLKTDLSEAHHHSAELTNLTPGTKYLYRVGDGSRWSEWCPFQTAHDRLEPFTFLYFGDAQYQIRSHWSRVLREAYATAPRARFMIHAGDLVNIGQRDAEWGEWFQAGSWLFRSVPVVPTAGNHEYIGGPDGRLTLPSAWQAQFALPVNGPTGLEASVYYLDFQGVRIICLNSNEKHAEQALWLERVLTENPRRWTIVTFHHPMFPIVPVRDKPEVRRHWLPLFARFQVDLVLQGHEHAYGRSGLLGEADEPGGTVYVVSVSGPFLNRVTQPKWAQRWGQGQQLFQVVHIDGARLLFEAYTALGELYDRFELHKQAPGQPNLLQESPELAKLEPSSDLDFQLPFEATGPPSPLRVTPHPGESEPSEGRALVLTLVVFALSATWAVIRLRRPRAEKVHRV
jgi:hypothetical protein